jgi:hypothetical protein
MLGIVRGLAIALVALGFFSAAHTPSPQHNAAAAASPSDIPVPVCPPNDPNGCHIDQW